MRRGPILIILSLLLAIFAAWVANNWIQSRAAALANSSAGVSKVAVADIEIPFGTKIEARHVSTMDLPTGNVPEGAYTDLDRVVGKIARSVIFSGEILLPGRLADAGSGSALAAVVEKNMRAVTVRVDDVVGVGGFLLPGNRVDVLASRRDQTVMITETILSNIKVLAVDQTAATDENKPVVVRAVTLEVTPAQAETLIKGKEAGTIQLTLRNPEDKTETVTRKAPPPVAAAPRPVQRQAPPPPTVTVIRGTEIRREK